MADRRSPLTDRFYIEAEYDENTQVVTQIGYQSDPYLGFRRTRCEERWTRTKFIAQGGFGSVWLETRQDDAKLRAVKRIAKTQATPVNFSPLQEADLMSILSHPKNKGLFVDFHGWFETENSICLVMEYVELGDLDGYLRRQGTLQEHDASCVVGQLLEGLEAIHSAGLVHRDVKPGNILIQRISPWWVKIGDFGLSKQVMSCSSITLTGGGTPGYKAPEVRFDSRTRQSSAIDMWSLGCVTHKILANSLPFVRTKDLEAFITDSALLDRKFEESDGISDLAATFISTLVVINPKLRASAEVALQSPWITKSSGKAPQSSPQNHSQLTSSPDQHSGTDGSTPRRANSCSASTSGILGTSSRAERAYTPLADLSPVLKRKTSYVKASVVSEVTDPMKMELPPRLSSRSDNHLPTSETQEARFNEEQVQASPASKASAVSQTSVSPKIERGSYGDGLRSQNDQSSAAAVIARYPQDIILSQPPFIPHEFSFDNESVPFTEQDISEAYGRLRWKYLDGRNALLRCATEGDLVAVWLLLQRGADHTIVNFRKWTPLHAAARNGHQNVVRLLLDCGALCISIDEIGQTPLHVATMQGHGPVVQLLLRDGAIVNIVDNNQLTPLHRAAFHGHKEVTQILLKYGAKVEVHDINRQTPLHQAASGGHSTIARMLLKEGANVGASDDNKLTPLHLAVRHRRQNVVRVLLEYRADHLALDIDDYSPLDIAIEQGHRDILKTIKAYDRIKYGPFTRLMRGIGFVA